MSVAYTRRGRTYTGDTGDGFAARKIGNVDEGVVEGGEDTGNAEDKLTLLPCQFFMLIRHLSQCHVPRGPEDRAGCSPGERVRPWLWEAFWRYMRSCRNWRVRDAGVGVANFRWTIFACGGEM